MKIKIVLGLLSLALCLLYSGCTTAADGTKKPFIFFNTSTNSIERKGFTITQIAITRVLQKHPRDAVMPKLVQAHDDLATLETADTITVAQIEEIIGRLPPDTFDDPNASLYIQGGILVFGDALESLAAQNPDQLRAAARGMRRGIETFLPKN